MLPDVKLIVRYISCLTYFCILPKDLKLTRFVKATVETLCYRSPNQQIFLPPRVWSHVTSHNRGLSPRLQGR